MDSDGLPLVGAGIDFSKVGAIHQKRTLAFLNHFVSHTVRFLNRFSCVCEEKLETLTVRLRRLETTMNVLEAKLSSIPGLENVTVPTNSESSETAAKPNEGQSQGTSSSDAQTSAGTEPSQTVPTEEAVHNLPEKPTKPVSQDPRYMKYFKMQHVGVPTHVVKMRMVADGLNGDYLDTPDAPAPEDDQGSKREDSDTDFSDNSQAEDSSDNDSSGFSD